MNARAQSFKLTLLTTVTLALALSACSRSEFLDKLSGNEGRKPQVVDGARRAPMLNPKMLPGAPDPSAEPRPVVSAPSEASEPRAMKPTPYDMYDEDGNEVVPEQKPESSNSSISDYFSKFVAKDSAAANDDGVVRKPIAENPYFAPEEQSKAPVVAEQPAAQSSFKPLMETQPDTDRDTVSGFVPVSPAPVAEAAAQNDAAPETQGRPSFLTRMMAPFKGASSADDKPEAMPADNAVVVNRDLEKDVNDHSAKDQAPQSLATVPPTPEKFQEVKQQKEEKMQELKLDHAYAQENKQELDAEPSQTQVSAPVKMDAPQAAADEPVLLGQMSDGKKSKSSVEPQTQDVAAPVEYARDNDVKAEATTPAAPEAETKPWWKRLNIMGDKSASEAPVAAEPVAVEAKPVDEKPFAPVAAEQPAIQPLIEQEQPTQTVAPFAPQNTPAVAPATYVADDVKTDDEPAKDASLPKTETLKKVKTLPPSRYNSRARDRQYYLVP